MAGTTKHGRHRITLTLDDAAVVILKCYASSERARGAFVSQLLWEHYERMVNATRERESLRAALEVVSKEAEAMAQDVLLRKKRSSQEP
jgi:hypothetical protein